MKGPIDVRRTNRFAFGPMRQTSEGFVTHVGAYSDVTGWLGVEIRIPVAALRDLALRAIENETDRSTRAGMKAKQTIFGNMLGGDE